MIGIIDRFEGEKAIVELDNGEIISVDRIKLPKEASEGDVLKINKVITIDEELTKQRKKKMDEMTKDMWE